MRDREGNIIIQKYNEKDDFHTKLMKALHTLNPDIKVNVHIEGFAAQNNQTNRIDWLEETPIPQETIDAEIARLQAEYDAQDYARKRKAEYPTIEELVVGLYDTDDKAAIDEKRAAVKLKHPKGV